MNTFRKKTRCLVLSFFGILFCVPSARALENGLALTPPMGWNSWNRFGCNVTEELFKSAADALVTSGMKDAGYEYVVIDDCWQVSRDAAGNIVADAKTFPSGIKALADYDHSKRLQVGLEPYAGPGHWNDPDMLEVGNGGMTATEYRSHFSLWCILAAPLMAGNDLKNMSPEIKEILTDKEVIAVDQDPLGMQGRRVRKNGDSEVWAKQLKDGGRAVVFFNRGASDADISASWEDLGYPAHLSAAVRDLWAKKDLGKSTGTFTAKVPSHAVVMLRITP